MHFPLGDQNFIAGAKRSAGRTLAIRPAASRFCCYARGAVSTTRANDGLDLGVVIFEWDPGKAATNLRKHRIAFEDAATVFLDPLAITFADPDHSTEETGR